MATADDLSSDDIFQGWRHRDCDDAKGDNNDEDNMIVIMTTMIVVTVVVKIGTKMLGFWSC